MEIRDRVESNGKATDGEGTRPFRLRSWDALAGVAAFRELRFAVLLGCSGNLRIEVDDMEFDVGPAQALTITPMQMVKASVATGAGWVLDFTYDGICHDEVDRGLVYDNGLFCHFGINQVLNLDPDAFARVEGIMGRLAAELECAPWGAHMACHSLVKLLLVEIARAKLGAQKVPLYRPDALMLRYLDLVRSSFQERPKIPSLAKRLGVSVATLDDACRRSTDESPQQLRDDLVVLEARRLLRYGGQSVKEVAASLGFADPLYFSRFFHKQTRTRPRDQLRRNLS
ncbi:MAG: helix-turn-helix domain-containing protein [Fibrobacterota bacterium]